MMKASDLARKLIKLIGEYGDHLVTDEEGALVAEVTFSDDLDVDGEIRPALFLTFDGTLTDVAIGQD